MNTTEYQISKYIGWVTFGTLVFYLVSVVVPCLLVLPTFLAWLVPLLRWFNFSKGTRNQSLLLLFTGILSILFSASQGIFLGWNQIFAINLPVLAMFVAVSFLTLTSPGIDDPSPPKGNNAVITTALGTHLLGAVINLSVLFVFGDRLKKKGALSRAQLIILTRSFCAAAWWSPFFVATGVALTYAPGLSWKETLIPGAIMTIIALGYSIIEVCYFRNSEFSGYPVKADSLTVPVLLATLVICTHLLWPDISILVLICILSPLGSVLFMKSRPRIAALNEFIDFKVVSVASQFALFLTAGVFSVGIKSITKVYPSLFHLEGSVFTPLLFTIVLGVMIIIGICGVHPIISIAIVSPLLLPLNPDQSQLGFLFLTTWAISTSSSPLSGVGLALASRYRIPPLGIIQNNWHYAIAMWATASILNIVFFAE